LKIFKASDLPEIIPIFPLSGALLLPRANLPLQLFEPKYLQMLEDALKTPNRLIGMVQSYRDAQGMSKLHSIGCAGRIRQFSETSDGRYMITLGGISRFRIKEEKIGFSPYTKAVVDWSSFTLDLGSAERDNAFDRKSFMKLLSQFFSSKDLKTDWDSLRDSPEELLINSLCILCPFEPEERQALLEAPSLVSRRETLVTLLEFSLREGGLTSVLQ
jgi:Lon protease-like protein